MTDDRTGDWGSGIAHQMKGGGPEFRIPNSESRSVIRHLTSDIRHLTSALLCVFCVSAVNCLWAQEAAPGSVSADPDTLRAYTQTESEYALGTQAIIINGNARRYRQYDFPPSQLLLFDRLYQRGSMDGGQRQYEMEIRRPDEKDQSLQFRTRDVDGPGHLELRYTRNGFFDEFGPTAGLTQRRTGEGDLRLAIGDRTQLHMEFGVLDFANPAGTLRPRSYSDSFVSLAAERPISSGVELVATARFEGYQDRSSNLRGDGFPLTADRSSQTYGVVIRNRTPRQIDWEGNLSLRQVNYPNFGPGYLALSGGLHAVSQASDRWRVRGAISKTYVARTISVNDFSGSQDVADLGVTYTGMRRAVVRAGARRVLNEHFSLRPGDPAPTPDAVDYDTYFVDFRYRSHNRLSVSASLRRQLLLGGPTTYIGRLPVPTTPALFPQRDVAKVRIGYPARDAGYLDLIFQSELSGNPGRNTGIRRNATTFNWSRQFGEKWWTTLQYELGSYATAQSFVGAFATDYDYLNLFGTYAWRHDRAVNLGCYLFRSRGGFAATTSQVYLSVAQREQGDKEWRLELSHAFENSAAALARDFDATRIYFTFGNRL